MNGENQHLHYFPQLVFGVMCRYNIFTCIFIFYQLCYVIFVSVFTKYLCHLGRKGYSQQNFVANCDFKIVTHTN